MENDIEDIIRDKIVSRIHDIAYDARSKTRATDEVRVQYNNALTFYGTHGIFFLPAQTHTFIVKHFNTSAVDIFKQIAKRDGRVFIMAMTDAYNYEGVYEHAYEPGVVSLILPKQKVTRLLVAPLNAIAHAVTGPGIRLIDRPLLLSPAPGMWRYHFKGEHGLELLQEFFKSCTEHPTNRLILKLYKKP